jgi:S1-C subfamily serine protease
MTKLNINSRKWNPIIKIFQIDSNKESLNLLEMKQYKIKNFGNGFFISKEGHIASVAHVINNEGVNPYVLFNGKFIKGTAVGWNYIPIWFLCQVPTTASHSSSEIGCQGSTDPRRNPAGHVRSSDLAPRQG